MHTIYSTTVRRKGRVRAYLDPEVHERMKRYTLTQGLGTLENAYNELIRKVISPSGEPLFVPVSREVKIFITELATELGLDERELMNLIFRRTIRRNNYI